MIKNFSLFHNFFFLLLIINASFSQNNDSKITQKNKEIQLNSEIQQETKINQSEQYQNNSEIITNNTNNNNNQTQEEEEKNNSKQIEEEIEEIDTKEPHYIKNGKHNIKHSKKELKEHQRDFDLIDLNKDKLIDASEIRKTLAGIPEYEISFFFERVDDDNSGGISFEEYINAEITILDNYHENFD